MDNLNDIDLTDPDLYDPEIYKQGILDNMSACTPLKVYLIIAVISTLIFYTYKIIKGHGFNLSAISSTMCGIVISGFIITSLCAYNTTIAWICAGILCFCSILSTLSYV